MVIGYLKTTVRYTGEMPVVSGHGEASNLVFPAFIWVCFMELKSWEMELFDWMFLLYKCPGSRCGSVTSNSDEYLFNFLKSQLKKNHKTNTT